MKKKLFILLIFVFSLFIPSVYALDTQYEVLYKMENQLKDNTFTIQFGLREQSAMVVMNSITYNHEKIELVGIDSNDYFTVTKSNETTNGVFSSFKILSDSDYAFQKVYYANVTFRIKDDFKQGQRTEIYISGNRIATADEILKTAPAMTYTVFYNKDGTIDYTAEEQNFMTQINMFLANNWKTVLIVLGVIVGLFIIIRYTIIIKDVKDYKDQHNHNHIVKRMRFARVSKKFRTVDKSKPEKVKLAKLGKMDKKKKAPVIAPVQNSEPIHSNINNLMASEPTEVSEQPTYQERGVFIGNQNTGNDNELPDDFSTFTEATNNYAYDDDTEQSEISSDGGANLDNLTNMSLQDNNNNNNSNNKIGIFLGLLLICGLFNMNQINALTDDEMTNLRNMILGNMTWSAEYDINNDNSIDMLDIIALKDINNITVIQDTMSVSDSKSNSGFELKSTSKYVRTTNNGTSRKRTTANGKWKNNGNNGGSSNNTQSSNGITSSGYVSEVSEEYTRKNIERKSPEQIDKTDGDETKYNVHINYENGSGDYDYIALPYNGSISFRVYYLYESTQKLDQLSCSSGKISNNGYKDDVYNITISNITSDTECTIKFDKSPSINANVNIKYQGSNGALFNNAINKTNQYAGTRIEENLNLDSHYTLDRIKCFDGFEGADYKNGKFIGTISDYSGTCTVYATPKRYKINIMYKDTIEFTYEAEYNQDVKGIELTNSNYGSNMKLYCGNDVYSPRSIDEITMNVKGKEMKGYHYILDFRAKGENCTLK